MKSNKLSLGSSKSTPQKSTYELNKLRVQASNASKQLQRKVAEHEALKNYYNSTVYQEQQNRIFKPLVDKLNEQTEVLRKL